MAPQTFDQDQRHRDGIQADKDRDQALARSDYNLREVMRTVSGRAFVWELLNDPWPLDSVHQAAATNTSRNEGQRDVTRRLYTRCWTECRAEFLLMVEENENR